jgi:predicted RNA-binding protein with RPS1 domain
MGFQVDRVTHILWFWLKEVVKWNLSLMEKKRKKKERERKKEEKEKKMKQKKKKVRSLDEWSTQQVQKTSFLYKAYYAKH